MNILYKSLFIMKTFWKIFFIVLGLIIFAGGCASDGTIAFLIQFFGAIIMMVGLLPIIDKESFASLKKNNKS